jgi:hypothetical protein
MNRTKSISLLFKVLAVVIVTLIAWSLRGRAVDKLPVDYDEDDYLRAAQQFTTLIRAKGWAGFEETNYRYEHPPLSKILFGVSLLSEPDAPLIPDRPTSAEPDKYLPHDFLISARKVGQVLGTVTVLLLSVLSPIAGLFLASHTLTIKYASQVMLEALPSLTSFVTVMAYIQSKKKKIDWAG